LLLLDECTTGVDPLAAARIVDYLKLQMKPHQGLLFSSHRIDETVSVCNKVLLLLQGQKYMEGSIKSFNAVAFKFFQVDVTIDPHLQKSGLLSVEQDNGSNMRAFLAHMSVVCNGESNIERIVVYSNSLVRLTFEKEVMSLFMVWKFLDEMVKTKSSDVRSFAFKVMDMEEVLATLISS